MLIGILLALVLSFKVIQSKVDEYKEMKENKPSSE